MGDHLSTQQAIRVSSINRSCCYEGPCGGFSFSRVYILKARVVQGVVVEEEQVRGRVSSTRG
jgi:hypothetical protein